MKGAVDMTTGEKIKARRLSLGLTAEELGRKVGVTKSTIGRYESGTIAKIPYFTFIKILAALDTNAEDLIAKEEFEPINSDGLETMELVFNEESQKLRNTLSRMTPSEIEKVDSFAQGIIAARPEGELPSR